MNIRKTIVASLLALSVPAAAFAHGSIWVDAGANVPKYKKIVLFPLSFKGREYDYLLDDNEGSLVYKMNEFIDKKFARNLKYTTIDLGSPLKENNAIRTDSEKYAPLYGRFNSEKERSKTVEDITMADAYLVPIIRESRVEKHLSPATYVDVAMRSWTEIKNSPEGDKTVNERTWIEHHLIPEKMRYLRHLSMEHTMYAEEGKKVLTFLNNSHTYETGEFEVFKNLINEFRKDLKDIKKLSFSEKGGKGVRIGFKPVTVSPSIGNDEYILRAANFAVMNGSERVKGVQFVYNDKGLLPAKYYVTGNITSWGESRTFVPPSVSTYWAIVGNVEERKWYDKEGKEHTMTITHYTTKITDNFAYYSYSSYVGGELSLVDARNNTAVVSMRVSDRDDKNGDAVRNMTKPFYKNVEQYLREHNAVAD